MHHEEYQYSGLSSFLVPPQNTYTVHLILTHYYLGSLGNSQLCFLACDTGMGLSSLGVSVGAVVYLPLLWIHSGIVHLSRGFSSCPRLCFPHSSHPQASVPLLLHTSRCHFAFPSSLCCCCSQTTQGLYIFPPFYLSTL